MELTIREKAFIRMLSRQKEAPSYRKDIEAHLGVDDRTVRKMVERLRNKGFTIIAVTGDNVGGYYIPNNDQDMREGFIKRKNRIEREYNVFKNMTSDLDALNKIIDTALGKGGDNE